MDDETQPRVRRISTAGIASASGTGVPKQPVGQMFGKYELVEMLGQGGMAEVWKAKVRGIAGFERSLVVKRVLPQLAEDEEFVAMFVREAQLCSMLNHANIVQVFELGELEGEYYLAMEYVRGHDLHAVLRARPYEPPPPGLGALVGRDICRALAYAHALCDEEGNPLRIIHRDVSPSNVMLALDGTVKLVDFGVAKALALASANLTSGGSVKGKLSYMAPEQLLGGMIDHRTDLFAVGIVVYEALAGRRLFKGDTDNETVERILTAKILAPSITNPDVPPELDAVVMRALQRDPALRYQTGEELADAFESCVHQLKWGASRISEALLQRFPEESSIKRASGFIMPPADIEAARAQSMQIDVAAPGARPTKEGFAPVKTASFLRGARKTAPFVHVAADMAAWTADAQLVSELPSAGAFDPVETAGTDPELVASSQVGVAFRPTVPVDPGAIGTLALPPESEKPSVAMFLSNIDDELLEAAPTLNERRRMIAVAIPIVALVVLVLAIVLLKRDRVRPTAPVAVVVPAPKVAAPPVAATPTAVAAPPTPIVDAPVPEPVAEREPQKAHRHHSHDAKVEPAPAPLPPPPPKPALEKEDVLNPF